MTAVVILLACALLGALAWGLDQRAQRLRGAAADEARDRADRETAEARREAALARAAVADRRRETDAAPDLGPEDPVAWANERIGLEKP